MHGELMHSVIIGDSIILPRELVECFKESQRDTEDITAVVNRDLKDELAIFKLEEWEKFEQIFAGLNIKNQHERLVGRFLRTAARDEIIRANEVYMGNQLSRWFRQVQHISCYEVPIVMYINKNEARGYERVQICIEEKYEKE